MARTIFAWQERSILSFFADWVERTPDKAAIKYRNEVLTYRQLDNYSDALAAAIAKSSPTPLYGKTLAVELPRGIWPVVAFLAALKTGAVYLPLDASQPETRLNYMLKDAEAVLILTLRENKRRARSGQTIFLEDIDRTPPAERIVAAEYNPGACIMYTSGSTGEPKGVRITQRGILRLVTAAEPYQIGADAVVAQCGNLAFDASTLEIWGALLNGATLAVIPYEQVINSARLAVEIKAQGVTDAWFTVALFNQLATDDAGMFGTLRNVLVGGDALNPGIIKSVMMSATPPGAIWNGYGPTENTVFTTLHRIAPEDCELASVPIGKAIAGTQCYVLDKKLRKVKPGEKGELYASGAGLAEGYLNKPDKTAEAFPANPFYEQELQDSACFASKTIYKTGDLVRERPDGALEFIGRADNQVKIRGYRLEIGEVEQALCRLAGVAQAVVQVTEQHGQKQLAAWCVSDRPSREILKALSELLPGWMLPSALQTLPRLPLTANGKVDKRRLPAITWGEKNAHFDNETERVIACIWQEILKLGGLPSREDDFFLLGGHSLLAVRVQQQIRQRLRKAVSLKQLFQFSGLAALTGLVASLPDQDENRLLRQTKPGQAVPLTPEQYCLWLDNQSDAASAKHHFCAVWRISGSFLPQRLDKALRLLQERHHSLRLRIRERSGVPYQLVCGEPFSLLIKQIAKEEELQRAIASLTSRPFNFAHEPLLRIRLYQCGEQEWALALVAHHIIIDGWSMGNFYRELALLYRSEAALPLLPIQFTDYALWRSQQSAQRDLAYWRKRLDGVEPLNLPKGNLDLAATLTQRIVFPADWHQRLLRRAEERQTGLYNLLYSALTLLLSRYCNQPGVPLAGVWANRPLAELEEQIGFFANTLILYTHIDEQQTVAQFLAQHHQQLMADFEHGAAPLHDVLAAHPLPRTGNVPPLCLVTLVLQNTGGGNGRCLHLPACEITPLPLPPEPAKCAMLFNVFPEQNGELTIEITVCQGLLPDSLAQGLPGHYRQLLEALCTQNGRLCDIPTLLPEEAARLLALNPLKKAMTPNDVLFYFRRQAARRAEAVAVRYLDSALCWRQLDSLSDSLAWQLRQHCGELRGERVVLAMERGLFMPVAMLAIVKTGAAYVPFDPSHPDERFRHILKDSGARGALVSPACAGRQQICRELVLTPEILQQEAEPFPAPKQTGEDILNVIYTSGSTGEPKGVRVKHKGIVRLVIDASHWQITPDTVIAQVGNIAFDASSHEIWGALLNGACMVIMPYETVIDSQALGDSLRRYGITDAAFCVALFNQLAEENPQAFSGLRNLIIGGDALNAQLIGKVLTTATPPGQIWNAYGPTENSVTTSMHAVSLADCESGVVPIGRPIAGGSCYVLSASGQLQPAGVSGELYVSGDGVAAGYLNNLQKTRAAFLPNPFYQQTCGQHSASEVMYKTGDCVRWQEDGTLLFLGRSDNQIKIRGFRLETDEVAQQLCRLTGITQAMVQAKKTAGETQLVGWCVSSRSPHDILQEFRTRLPAFMIPAELYVLERFPLTANGKIDRQRLANYARGEAASGLTPCLTRTERELEAIWRQLLQREQPVFQEQNFFDLGGHSLLVIKMAGLIAQRLHKKLEVAAIFRADSLKTLAQTLDGEPAGDGRERLRIACENDARLPEGRFRTADKMAGKTLLLTGASGFLGIYLLAELQRQLPESRIVCLVRADDDAAALQRLRVAAARYQLSLKLAQIEAWPGDLSRARLGMDEERWHTLAESVDGIYHCGAYVNHLHSYSALRASNVGSTLELLALCRQGRAKQMFYVSTLSTAPRLAAHVLENSLAKELETDNGYVLTKWVCERLMAQAFQQGLSGSVFRMGNIIGSTANGISNIEDNHLMNLIKGCLQQGVAPDWRSWRIDLSPVDLLASLLVKASLRRQKQPEIVNLGFLATLPWKTLLTRIAQHLASPLKFVAPEEWAEKWVPAMDSRNALYPFRAFYLQAGERESLTVEHAWVDKAALAPDAEALLVTCLRFWREAPFFNELASTPAH
ncbi:amino acid adenylation domain-containing protein [Kalamiella sp. sgz302252]|uniref:non-ribosomal peptide synthetase n=1 Tax=Pantoea sp. sgz302252 TaxID=3341827 RepID=UPI0036D40579